VLKLARPSEGVARYGSEGGRFTREKEFARSKARQGYALAPHCFGIVCGRREYGNVLHIFAKTIKLKSAQKLYEVLLFLRS
jgi:hypothetical protein